MAASAGDLVETLEDVLLVFRSNATTGIRDLEPGNPFNLIKMLLLLRDVLNAGRDRHLPTRGSMAQGVAQQVAQHLLKPQGVGVEAGKISGNINAGRYTAIGGGQLHFFDSIGNDIRQAHNLPAETQLPGVGPRDDEQIFYQRVEVLAASSRPQDEFALGLA